ncbi:hypothetical protein F5146DRAFT_995301 [Armillaria mellea]|nr:hypothetical protein F5146DRAFT_995301 [Armillaria mellea]
MDRIHDQVLSPCYFEAALSISNSQTSSNFVMALKYYYIRIGLQTRDAFFGNTKQIYNRSPSLVDDFPAKVLLEAERSSGWHTSLLNPRHHYTLRGYNGVGWMAVTLEMEAKNRGMVFTYHPADWNCWKARSGGIKAKHFFNLRDHVEAKMLNFLNIQWRGRSTGTCGIVRSLPLEYLCPLLTIFRVQKFTELPTPRCVDRVYDGPHNEGEEDGCEEGAFLYLGFSLSHAYTLTTSHRRNFTAALLATATNRTTAVAGGDAPNGEGPKMKEGCDGGQLRIMDGMWR